MFCRSYSLPVLVLLAFLTSCSRLEPLPPPASASPGLDSWHARGRFSYRSDEVTESGNFDWRQYGSQYQLRLYGPMGMGTVRISGNPDMVRIQTQERDISSDQPLHLVHHMTGLEIPLNSLPQWLLGEPAGSGAIERQTHSDGGIAGFREYGWLLNYPGYQDTDAGRRVPEELRARKDGIELRLLIRSFSPL